MSNTKFAVLAAVGVLSGAGSALAQPLQFSLEYLNLNGRYAAPSSSSAPGTFTANAVNYASQVVSSGKVTRNAAPGSTSNFLAGFTSITPATFSLTLSVADRTGSNASGFGSFVSTDVLGNRITGDIVGDRLANANTGWFSFGSFITFSGTLANVQWTSVNGTNYIGSDGSATNFSDFLNRTFTGALVQLSINPAGGFFGSDFGYDGSTGVPVPTNVNAQLVPTPAGAGVLALGGVLAARRRRR